MLCILQESSLGIFGKLLSKAMFLIIQTEPWQTNGQGAQTLCCKYSVAPVHVKCSFTEAHTCTKTFTGGSLVQAKTFSYYRSHARCFPIFHQIYK